MNETFTFSDLFSSAFLSNFSSDISLSRMLITLLFALAIGSFIYVLYRRIFSGVLYSKSFNTSLIGMTIITAFIIMAISSNLILSLGMVGALSIVRFRTPIKDPTDLVFLFWSVAVGIVTGAGFYTLALIGSAVVGLVLFLYMKKASFDTPYLLLVHCDSEQSEQHIAQHVARHVKRFNIKQKTVTRDNIELTLEIRLKNNEPGFINQLTAIDGVSHAMLISYNGDYVS